MNTIVKKQCLNKNFVNFLTKLHLNNESSENSGTFNSSVKSTYEFFKLQKSFIQLKSNFEASQILTTSRITAMEESIEKIEASRLKKIVHF